MRALRMVALGILPLVAGVAAGQATQRLSGDTVFDFVVDGSRVVYEEDGGGLYSMPVGGGERTQLDPHGHIHGDIEVVPSGLVLTDYDAAFTPLVSWFSVAFLAQDGTSRLLRDGFVGRRTFSTVLADDGSALFLLHQFDSNIFMTRFELPSCEEKVLSEFEAQGDDEFRLILHDGFLYHLRGRELWRVSVEGGVQEMLHHEPPHPHNAPGVLTLPPASVREGYLSLSSASPGFESPNAYVRLYRIADGTTLLLPGRAPQFDPEGRRALSVRAVALPEMGLAPGLFLTDLATGTSRRIDPSSGREPIAFKAAWERGVVVVLEDGLLSSLGLAGGPPTYLTSQDTTIANSLYYNFDGNSLFSADGARIFFAAATGNYRDHEYRSVPVAGGPTTTHGAASRYFPSPDGRIVLLEERVGNLSRLVSVPVDGGFPRVVSGSFVWISKVAFTADSKRVFYIAADGLHALDPNIEVDPRADVGNALLGIATATAPADRNSDGVVDCADVVAGE